jgi:hypothetical protein
MSLTRRRFTGLALTSMAMGALAAAVRAADPQQSPPTARGYGPLIADPLGLLDLPSGFTYSVISTAGERMNDGFVVPDHFDGMGCLGLGNGLLALVRNHELGPAALDKGPSGGDATLLARLAKLPAFDRDNSGRVLPGGTTTLVYDPGSRRVQSQWLSLSGTATNCAGGMTPWGTWLSCEESVVGMPDVQRPHGWVFEVAATVQKPVEPIALQGLGRFRHEAAAIDPDTGIAYLTEDREDSLLYRFLPERPGNLAAGGRLQALALVDGLRDSRNWVSADLRQGSWNTARWIDLEGVDSPQDDLRLRGADQGALIFARGEGIHMGRAVNGQQELYFCCTSGGAGHYGQVHRLQLGAAAGADRLQLFLESTDPQRFDYGDNITVAPWGHLVVCEDRTGNKVNHLRAITPAGALYTIARLNADTELAGACFSPDGTTMFVNAYAPGRTLAITGPWRSVSA